MNEIERGIPLPPVTAGRKSRHPFRAMEVGDSFWTSVGVNITQWGLVTGHKYSRRKEVKDGVAGMRIWRIA